MLQALSKEVALVADDGIVAYKCCPRYLCAVKNDIAPFATPTESNEG